MTASRASSDCRGFEFRAGGQIQQEFMVFSVLNLISDPFLGAFAPSRRTSRIAPEFVEAAWFNKLLKYLPSKSTPRGRGALSA